jgi:mycothiol synthase
LKDEVGKVATRIRPFVHADYSRVSASFPSSNLEAQLLYDDRSHDPKCKCKRFVVEDNGQIIAVAWYEQLSEMYNSREFVIQPIVLRPNSINLITVEQLYEYILNDLGQLKPGSVRVLIAMDNIFSSELIAFLKGREFQEDRDLSLLMMRLDPAAFKLEPFAEYEDRVREQGIEIKTLNDLRAEQARDRKLYELFYELRKGLPHQTTQAPFDYFMKQRVKKSSIVPEAYFVAIHDGEYVGLSYMEVTGQVDLYIKFTGARAAYQRRGIALTLKLKGIAYAKQHKYKTVTTTNNASNEPIIRLNTKLGFVRQPAFDTVMLVKDFRKK